MLCRAVGDGRLDGGRDFVVHTNLLGAYHCFEAAARRGAQVIFLSTSRVYPIAGLSALALHENATRFELDGEGNRRGLPADRQADALRRHQARLRAPARRVRPTPWVVNRCGVIAGPWQMGKVDQGVFTHWALSHRFGRPLSYIGFGGTGKQVRDLSTSTT